MFDINKKKIFQKITSVGRKKQTTCRKFTKSITKNIYTKHNNKTCFVWAIKNICHYRGDELPRGWMLDHIITAPGTIIFTTFYLFRTLNEKLRCKFLLLPIELGTIRSITLRRRRRKPLRGSKVTRDTEHKPEKI